MYVAGGEKEGWISLVHEGVRNTTGNGCLFEMRGREVLTQEADLGVACRTEVLG